MPGGDCPLHRREEEINETTKSNPARNPSIFRRRFPIRSWYPSQHLLRQNPPKEPVRIPERVPGTARVAWARDGAGNPIEVVGAWSDVTRTQSAHSVRQVLTAYTAPALPEATVSGQFVQIFGRKENPCGGDVLVKVRHR
jgi:hypothetical protein